MITESDGVVPARGTVSGGSAQVISSLVTAPGMADSAGHAPARSLFKTTPMAHQLREFQEHGADRIRALFWEMGTGKTKAVLDSAAAFARAHEIDGLLVLAPKGVHENWILDEVPAHLPDDVGRIAFSYSTQGSGTKRHQGELEETTRFRGGLAILAMSYSSFMTLAGRRAAEKFLHERRCMYVLDESQMVKTPGIKRTISVVATGRRTPFKRILSGTPITNNPFDIYSQMKFLDEGFWKAHGHASYESFKVFFGNWVERVLRDAEGHERSRFMDIVSYKNLDILGNIVAGVSSRILKADVLDLPPKTYTKVYFDLTAEQKKVYKQLRDEFMVELDSGALITAPLMITRLLRFQQITCGYLPTDGASDTDAPHRFPENPRLRALSDLVEHLDGQAIILARFREDVDQIMALLGKDAVRYDGATSDEQRLEARRAFQSGAARFFVGNPAVAGTGLTLTAASTVIYYSNSFDLAQRLQSEDRAHRIGQTKKVTYVDLVAKGTVDARIIGALREKLELASLVTRDAIRDWI